jgi:ribonuclease P protein component
MLKRLYRITKKKDFDNIFKNGRNSFDNFLGFKIKENIYNYNRFGIIVSAKVSKKAVIRNKIKRQIREIIRQESDNLGGNFDCLIITLPPVKEEKYEKISTSLKKHFKKLNLYKK